MKDLLRPALTSLLFSGSFVAAKYATLELEPLTTTLLRYAIALGFVSMLVAFRGGAGSLRVRPADLPAIAATGLLGVVGYHYFFFVALRHTEVANTAILNSSSPVVTGLAAALVLGERLSRRHWAGVALALCGVVVLIAHGSLSDLLALRLRRGDAWMMVSVVSWVGYALLIRGLLRRYAGLVLTWYAAASGVAVLLLLAWSEPVAAQLRQISPRGIAALLYMGLAASGLGYLLYNASIERIGPTRTSSYVYSLLPICVALLALWFFDQAITGPMWISMAVIALGLRLTLPMSAEPAPPGCQPTPDSAD